MKTYVIDDDPAYCRMVSRQLAAIGQDHRCFRSIDAFTDAAPLLPAGCVLLDIHLGDANGLSLLRQLGESYPDWPVIIVSGTTQVDDAIQAFRAGAIHLLRKPYRQEDLIAALAEAQKIFDDRRRAGERHRQASSIHLTTREREVLGALAQGKLSKTIAFDLGISRRTVEMYRSSILTKVAARNSAQAIATCRTLGLI